MEVSAVGYIMEDPREAIRLERKLDPQRWITKHLVPHLSPGDQVLSVGCGPATDLREVAAMYPSIYTTGLDVSAARLKHARESNKANPFANFVCGDAHHMEFPSNTFDLVYSRMLLQYTADKQQVVAEMTRVCKPGGTVVLQDLDGQLVWHYPEDPSMQAGVNKAMGALAQTGFDPFVGRKLFWFAKQAGLENLNVQVECYHLIAGRPDSEILSQWEMKLAIAKPSLISALGSEEEAAEQSRHFLDYLKRPDTLTFSNVFTVTGEKPL